MCTVTYIPTPSGFIFTSNRDEKFDRETKNPDYYVESKVNLFYPKDEVAGGTWIGVSENKRLVCLLNGGFVYHNPQLKFLKSRGVVVKTLLTSFDVLKTMKELELDGVAPFTLIVVDWNQSNQIYELVWCKEKKHINRLDSNKPSIWSSSTLYNDEMKTQRVEWFAKSGLNQSKIKPIDVLKFHQNKDFGNAETTIKMKRDLVETVSTTMVIKEDKSLHMNYFDYVNDKELNYTNIFSLVNA
ncbi:NRDE family protein [Wenyingzhuangia sp. IMCC45533]